MRVYSLVAQWGDARVAILGEHGRAGLDGNYKQIARDLLLHADRNTPQQSYLCDNFRFCCLFVESFGFLCLAAAKSPLADQFAYLESLSSALLPLLQPNSGSLQTLRQLVQLHFESIHPPVSVPASAFPIQVCLPPPTVETMGQAALPRTNSFATNAVDPFASPFPEPDRQPPSAVMWSQPTATLASNPFDDVFLTSTITSTSSEGCWLDQFSAAPATTQSSSFDVEHKVSSQLSWGSKDDISVLFIPEALPDPIAVAPASHVAVSAADSATSGNGHGTAEFRSDTKRSHRRRSSEPRSSQDNLAATAILHESTFYSARARSTDTDRMHTPKRVGHVADIGLILPIDYSGMSDDGSADGAKLLSKLDTQVKNALVTQLGIANSYDEVMTVVHMFREILATVPLPPAMSVRFEQAVKDANRERIQLGKQLFASDFTSLWDALQATVRPLVVGGDEMIVEAVCKDILRASSRTASGGDSYSIISCLFGSEDVVITPAQVLCQPIAIKIDRAAFVISIVSEDKFVMRRVDEMEPSSQFEPSAVEASSAAAPGKSVRRRKSPKSFGFLFGKRTGQKPQSAISELPQNEQISELHPQGKSLPLTCVMTTELRLIDTMTPCTRMLSITTDLVEQTPEQLIVLGAGDPRVNKNPYELQGFRNRSPWYLNRAGVHFTLEHLPADDTWLWAMGIPPVCLYLSPGESGQMPPLDGWQPQCEAVPGPAPTVMPSSKRLTKKRSTPRNMPQQASSETPLNAQFKLFGRRLSVSSTTSSVDDERRTPKNAPTPDRRVVTDIMNSIFDQEEKNSSSADSEPIAPLPIMDLGCAMAANPTLPAIDTSEEVRSSDISSQSSPVMVSPVRPIRIQTVAALAGAGDTNDAPATAEDDAHTPTSASMSSVEHAAEAIQTPDSGAMDDGLQRPASWRFKPRLRWFEHGNGGDTATSSPKSPQRPNSKRHPSLEHSSSGAPGSSNGLRPKSMAQFAIRPWRKGNACRPFEDYEEADDDAIGYGMMASFNPTPEPNSP